MESKTEAMVLKGQAGDAPKTLNAAIFKNLGGVENTSSIIGEEKRLRLWKYREESYPVGGGLMDIRVGFCVSTETSQGI